MPAVLSGEMKDTAQLNAFAVYGLEKFLSRHERAEIFRAMPGISSMLPLGGNAVWGDHTGAPDDLPGQNISYGNFMRFARESNSTLTKTNLTVEESFPYLFKNSEQWYKEMVMKSYSHGVAHTAHEVEDNQLIPAKWINPLETRLPLAPSLKIYCFYGIGKPTERAFYYRDDADPLSKLNVTLDTMFSDGDADHGVVLGEGDGTVNLLSSGYMCAKGWKMKRYNPAGVKITTYEMPHEPDRFSPRGGPNTGKSFLSPFISPFGAYCEAALTIAQATTSTSSAGPPSTTSSCALQAGKAHSSKKQYTPTSGSTQLKSRSTRRARRASAGMRRPDFRPCILSLCLG
jgi:phospholipid:diacylglycerol acyltransferase